jgi:hypothetical protein
MIEIDNPKEFDFAIAGTIQHLGAPQRWGGVREEKMFFREILSLNLHSTGFSLQS